MPLLADWQADNPERLCLHAPQNVLGGIKLHPQSDNLDNTPILAFLPSFLFPSPTLLLPRIASQINYLHTISYLRLSFPEGAPRIAKVSSLCNPDKSQGTMRLSLGRMSSAQPSKQQWHHEKEFQSLASIKMHQRESNTF